MDTIRLACEKCGSVTFSIIYDPIAQGEHIECSECHTVHFMR